MQAERLVPFLHIKSDTRHDTGPVHDPGMDAVCGIQPCGRYFRSVPDIPGRENGRQIGLGRKCPAVPVPEGSLNSRADRQAVYVHGIFFRAEHTAGIGLCPESGHHKPVISQTGMGQEIETVGEPDTVFTPDSGTPLVAADIGSESVSHLQGGRQGLVYVAVEMGVGDIPHDIPVVPVISAIQGSSPKIDIVFRVAEVSF